MSELYQKLNLETGRILWPELQRHYARGALIIVEPQMDLVEVATIIAKDNASQVEEWIRGGQLRRAQDEDAQRWQSQTTEFWACVVAPWVLVQEIAGHIN